MSVGVVGARCSGVAEGPDPANADGNAYANIKLTPNPVLCMREVNRCADQLQRQRGTEWAAADP